MLLWVTAFVCLLLVCTLATRIAAYRKALGYSPSSSHHYTISQECQSVSVSDSYIDIDHDGSAILSLTIKSNVLGWLADPRIDFISSNTCLSFVFERGCSGKRFLCIPKSLASSAKIQVSSRSLKIEPEVEVYPFSDPQENSPKTLILAPHPDDAEIMAFSILHQRPQDTWIVTVTTGDKGQTFRDSTAPADITKPAAVQARLHDSLTVPQQFGIPAETLANLGYSETALSGAQMNNRVPVSGHRQPVGSPLLRAINATSSDNLVSDLVHILESVQPEIVVIPHPLLDSHEVHLGVAAALLDAMSKCNNKPLLYCSIVHPPGLRCYPLGEVGDGIALPPNSRDEKLFDRVEVRELNEEAQFLKSVALDAHHDLREPPQPYRKAVSTFATVRRALRERISGAQRVASKDYFRRAVRACEIFLVYEPSSLEILSQNLQSALHSQRK